MLPDNQTKSFLGDAATWPRVQIRLEDVQGLWGGRNVFASGMGRLTVQRVSPGLFEQRYELSLSEAEIRSLVHAFIEQDFVTLRIEMRYGIPDEAHPQITLINAAGQFHSVGKWAGQRNERFDRLYAELLKLEGRTENLAPAHSGKYEWGPPPKGAAPS